MRPVLLELYRLVGFLLYPLVRLVAPLLRYLPGRIAYQFSQRLGLFADADLACLPGVAACPRIWVHAASMGEVQAALLLLRALRKEYGDCRPILSCTTKQGHALAQSRLPEDTPCIMAPLDMPQAVQRALRAIRPSVYICLETELWPLLLSTLHQQGVPMLLLNGRISERSLGRYQKLGKIITTVLQGFDKMAVISQLDMERFAALGVLRERMLVAGNIKFDLPLDTAQADIIRATLRARLGLAPHEQALICGSTHGGEEAQLLAVFKELQADMPLVLLLAPRHQERLAEVEALLQGEGLAFARYSRLQGVRNAAVVLVDTMGDLAELYSAGDFLFCGGSLLPRLSGHNIMEAARWGRPVYYGPHMKDWQGAADLLSLAGGGFQVKNTGELTALIRRHADSKDIYAQACQAAQETARAQQGALKRQMALVGEVLSRACQKQPEKGGMQ